jgi:hypothetical protein
MPRLLELGKKERNEICRTIARAAHDCLSKTVDDDGCVLGGTFAARMYKACSDLGVIEDDEFYGNAFSAKRVEVLQRFAEIHAQALDHAKVYDDATADMVANGAPDFPMPSHTLVRIWCISRYVAMLMSDGPFADLRVTMCVAEDDEDDGTVENEQGEPRSSDDEDEDDDSIVASSSDEDGDESGSEEGSGEDEGSDIEEVTPEEAQPVDGPRRKKPRVKQEAPESDASDADP